LAAGFSAAFAPTKSSGLALRAAGLAFAEEAGVDGAVLAAAAAAAAATTAATLVRANLEREDLLNAAAIVRGFCGRRALAR
jgi:hypothetical protein